MQRIVTELISAIDLNRYFEIKKRLQNPYHHEWTDQKMILAMNLFRQSGFMELLKPWDFRLAGTIPIGLSVKGSDLDVICSSPRPGEVLNYIKNHKLRLHPDLKITAFRYPNELFSSALVEIEYENLPIEIFIEAKETEHQNAFRHMLIEALLLEMRENLRSKIIHLKSLGVKTEPAFGLVFNLCQKGEEANSYQLLLKLLDAVEEKWIG